MEINIRMLNAHPLWDIKQAAGITLGDISYTYVTPKNEVEFWRNRFIEKHSIIRAIHFRIIWEDIRSDVARQIIRATKGHPQPYVQSSRPDWTGHPRPSDPSTPIVVGMDFTAESFMALCNQRLCYRAMKETRNTIIETIHKMATLQDTYFKALVTCLVPNCVLYCGCPEIGKRNCGWFEMLGPKDFNITTRQEKYKDILLKM